VIWEVNAVPLTLWRGLGSPILGMISLQSTLVTTFKKRPFLSGWKGLNPLGEGIHWYLQKFVARTKRHRNKVSLPVFPKVNSKP
jgi:hypothetical protein